MRKQVWDIGLWTVVQLQAGQPHQQELSERTAANYRHGDYMSHDNNR